MSKFQETPAIINNSDIRTNDQLNIDHRTRNDLNSAETVIRNGEQSLIVDLLSSDSEKLEYMMNILQMTPESIQKGLASRAIAERKDAEKELSDFDKSVKIFKGKCEKEYDVIEATLKKKRTENQTSFNQFKTARKTLIQKYPCLRKRGVNSRPANTAVQTTQGVVVNYTPWSKKGVVSPQRKFLAQKIWSSTLILEKEKEEGASSELIAETKRMLKLSALFKEFNNKFGDKCRSISAVKGEISRLKTICLLRDTDKYRDAFEKITKYI
ncbi:MAG: hypothetical protein CXT73_05000 [Methanobacteriota archaeon]|nr:MAG: hypothetical protein CXT73_05000 [Euryarchaeota archaeon]